MGWRDLIVTSHLPQVPLVTPRKGSFEDIENFGPSYRKKNSLSIKNSPQNSTPTETSPKSSKLPATAGASRSVVLRVREPLTLELDGQAIALDRWAVFTVAADQAVWLLEQFPAQLERLDLPPDPLAEPLRQGWLVCYRDRAGRLAGGCDDRRHGTVKTCAWIGSTWMATLTDGQQLPLSRIVSVGQTDEDGRVVSAWTTREHGYGGAA